MHVAPFHTRVPVHSVCPDELRAPRAAPFMSDVALTTLPDHGAFSMGTFRVHVPHPGAVKQT